MDGGLRGEGWREGNGVEVGGRVMEWRRELLC